MWNYSCERNGFPIPFYCRRNPHNLLSSDVPNDGLDSDDLDIDGNEDDTGDNFIDNCKLANLYNDCYILLYVTQLYLTLHLFMYIYSCASIII